MLLENVKTRIKKYMFGIIRIRFVTDQVVGMNIMAGATSCKSVCASRLGDPVILYTFLLALCCSVYRLQCSVLRTILGR